MCCWLPLNSPRMRFMWVFSLHDPISLRALAWEMGARLYRISKGSLILGALCADIALLGILRAQYVDPAPLSNHFRSAALYVSGPPQLLPMEIRAGLFAAVYATSGRL